MVPGERDVAIDVAISDTQGHVRAPAAKLISLARSVLLAERCPRASISIALVDQATIHAINRTHLGHDWPTDVITFPLSEPGETPLAGELVISAEMAASVAAEMGNDPLDELALYVIHGLLHLCGHDDLTEAGAAAMRRRQDELLRAFVRPDSVPGARCLASATGPAADIPTGAASGSLEQPEPTSCSA